MELPFWFIPDCTKLCHEFANTEIGSSLLLETVQQVIEHVACHGVRGYTVVVNKGAVDVVTVHLSIPIGNTAR